MKIQTVLMAGVAAVTLAAGGVAFAQTPEDAGTNMFPGEHHGAHHATAGMKGRPLTVRRTMAPAPGPVNPITGVTTAVATPFNGLGAPGQVIGSSITGAGVIASAPFGGLMGMTPGLSADVAPPLPIKARYAGTGPVKATFDEGFSQDVPVDGSGPIYQIDNTGRDRTVTPFSLIAAFPAAATYAVTSPLRPVARP